MIALSAPVCINILSKIDVSDQEKAANAAGDMPEKMRSLRDEF